MDDLVAMLRTPTGCVPPNEWEIKAADEIERYRKAMSWLEDHEPGLADEMRRKFKLPRF